ncbi:MAG: N-acetylmuramoyl-L-alanine amidase [Candidatus Kerfeldbacteria bacterium]|nr:N-acetylmuramoyl-L-alanine amidase [Candidatus Kerfeldbacteria bacterium]
MQNGYVTTRSFLFGSLLAAIVVFFGIQAIATTIPEVRSNEEIDSTIPVTNGTFRSEIITADYPFQVGGFAWRGDSTDVAFEFRLYVADGWSVWYHAESDSYVEQNGYQYLREPFMANNATQIEYRLTADGAIDDVKFIYVQSSDPPAFGSLSIFDWLFKRASAASAITIIPRSGWEANETWRYDAQGKEEWVPEVVTPEKFIVHHTAGDPGTSDPAATIRSIYYWHAVVLNWGDIGYNYLIDQNGNIYEGRYGGDGVIGAHAYRSAACAASRFGGSSNEASFNRGTIGIAILGDYEAGLALNQKVQTALQNLIGTKAALFGIDPTGTSEFIDASYPNIIGHSDVDCTSCPGKNLYSAFSNIRSGARSVFLAQGGIPGSTQLAFSGEVVTQDIRPATFTRATQTITTTVRNTGTETWTRGQVKLNIYDLGDNVSRFRHSSWPSQWGGFDFSESSVAPGGTATFTSTLQSPDRMGTYLNIYRLTGPADINQEDDRSITRVDSRLQAALISNTMPPALLYLWRPAVTIKFKNTGLATWDRHVTLEAMDLGGAVSRFRDRSWLSNYTTARLQETTVAPGQIGTFTLRLDPPNNPGLYLNSFFMQRYGEMVQNGSFSIITRVDG